MRVIVSILIAVPLMFLVSAQCEAANATTGKKFGAPITVKESLNFDTILEKPQAYANQVIATEGTVKKVCQKKGCWMEVGGAKQKTRVTFKNYGFFVPADILNKKVKLQGKIIEETLSVKEQKHYLEDEHAPKEQIDAVKEPKKVYNFVADGVELI